MGVQLGLPSLHERIGEGKTGAEGLEETQSIDRTSTLRWVMLVGMAAYWFRRDERLKGGALFFDIPCPPQAVGALSSVQRGRRSFSQGSRFRTWSVVISPLEHERSKKTGRFDDSVILDTLECWMLQPLAENVTGGLHCGDSLVSTRVCMTDRDRAREQPRTGRHTCQNGGASVDTLTNQRTLIEVRNAGTMDSLSSVRRYKKAGRASL